MLFKYGVGKSRRFSCHSINKPRLAESLEIIAEILHPAHFDFHHQQSGWEQL